MALDQLYKYLERESETVNRVLTERVASLPPLVAQVAMHILAAGGKRLRPFLTVVCARMLGLEGSDIYPLAASLEMLHCATLLHDDVLDGAGLRRGKIAAHYRFGIPETILAGDALLALGNAVVASYGNPQLSLCYSRATMDTAAGEILEMSSLRSPELNSGQYLEIARGKTACLIAQACAMGALAANARESQIEACANYGENLGLGFQLVDDALDYAPCDQTGKPIGGDLREGKMTPPISLYRSSLIGAELEEFDRHFKTGDFTESQIAYHIEAIAPFAVASLNLADECLHEARMSLAQLPAGEYRDLLQEITAYVRFRQK